jgi:hypothetical protein
MAAMVRRNPLGRRSRRHYSNTWATACGIQLPGARGWLRTTPDRDDVTCERCLAALRRDAR